MLKKKRERLARLRRREEPKPEKATRKPDSLDCRRRGKNVGRVHCGGCRGNTAALFACTLHGECVLLARRAGVAVCADCPDRSAD